MALAHGRMTIPCARNAPKHCSKCVQENQPSGIKSFVNSPSLNSGGPAIVYQHGFGIDGSRKPLNFAEERMWYPGAPLVPYTTATSDEIANQERKDDINALAMRSYKQGSIIHVQIQITAQHFGFFQWSICPDVNNVTNSTINHDRQWSELKDQAVARCFEHHRLEVVPWSDGNTLKRDKDNKPEGDVVLNSPHMHLGTSQEISSNKPGAWIYSMDNYFWCGKYTMPDGAKPYIGPYGENVKACSQHNQQDGCKSLDDCKYKKGCQAACSHEYIYDLAGELSPARNQGNDGGTDGAMYLECICGVLNKTSTYIPLEFEGCGCTGNPNNGDVCQYMSDNTIAMFQSNRPKCNDVAVGRCEPNQDSAPSACVPNYPIRMINATDTVADKTTAYFPNSNGQGGNTYWVQLQLPVISNEHYKHALLQWHWQTGNSPGHYPEMFRNVADIELLPESNEENVPSDGKDVNCDGDAVRSDRTATINEWQASTVLYHPGQSDKHIEEQISCEAQVPNTYCRAVTFDPNSCKRAAIGSQKLSSWCFNVDNGDPVHSAECEKMMSINDGTVSCVSSSAVKCKSTQIKTSSNAGTCQPCTGGNGCVALPTPPPTPNPCTGDCADQSNNGCIVTPQCYVDSSFTQCNGWGGFWCGPAVTPAPTPLGLTCTSDACTTESAVCMVNTRSSETIQQSECDQCLLSNSATWPCNAKDWKLDEPLCLSCTKNSTTPAPGPGPGPSPTTPAPGPGPGPSPTTPAPGPGPGPSPTTPAPGPALPTPAPTPSPTPAPTPPAPTPPAPSPSGDCKLSDWSDWTACSASCSIGTQTRARSVTQGVCPDTLVNTRGCNLDVPCNANDCAWQTGSCSTTCGLGTQPLIPVKKDNCTVPQHHPTSQTCFLADCPHEKKSRTGVIVGSVVGGLCILGGYAYYLHRSADRGRSPAPVDTPITLEMQPLNKDSVKDLRF